AQTFLIDSIENNDATILKQAQDEANLALEYDPKCVRALVILGEIAKERGDFDRAREYFDRGLKIEPENPRLIELCNATRNYKVKEEVQDKLSLAKVYLERNHIENAIMEYESVLELDPNNYQATFQLAEIYLNQNLIDIAVKFFQRTKSIKPDFIESYRRLAEIFKSQGDSDKFISECMQIIEREPDDPIVHLELARSYMQNGYYDEALAELKQVITIDPQCSEAHQYLGQIYERTELFDDAKECYNRVLQLDPNNSVALDYFANQQNREMNDQIQEAFNKAKEHEDINEIDKAIEEYDRILEIRPGNLEVHYRLGNLYEKKKAHSKALFEYQRAIEIDPEKYKDIYLKAGNVARELKDHQEAISFLSKAHEYFPENKQARKDLLDEYKIVYLEAETPNKADDIINKYKEILDSKPDDPLVNYEIGFLYNNLPLESFNEENVRGKAIFALKKATEIMKGDIDVHFELARAYKREAMYDEAVSEYQKIIELAPQNVEARLTLGYILELNRQFDEAMEQYNKCVEFDKGCGEAHARIVDLYYKMYEKDENKTQKFFQLLQDYKKAAEGNFTDAMVHYRLGYAYIKLSAGFGLTGDEKANAQMEFKQAISIDNTNLYPYWGLKIVYQKESLDG
ncbi:MAG TPA: tetratricopeptide repeat protein, partial [Candidatus Wallbacteria bacterium]|nr:tetratricopeptide repeat protein [Candidatus Wallbacteria bacterium]